MSGKPKYAVETRVEAAFGKDESAFYPGQITKVHPGNRYDILYDDGDKETKVPDRLIRQPVWRWLDAGVNGVSPNKSYHHSVVYNRHNMGILTSGDIVIVKNLKGKPIQHKKTSVNFYVAEILCFFEEYTEADVDDHKKRLKRNPFARYVLDTDVEKNKRTGVHDVVFPGVELRWFYFPEQVFKESGSCDSFLPGEIFESDETTDEWRLDDILAFAAVTPKRDDHINNQPTQMTQEDSGDWWNEEDHSFFCQNFYDHQAKRLRRVAFKADDPKRGRQYSRHLLDAVLQTQPVASTSITHSNSNPAARRQDRPSQAGHEAERKRSRVDQSAVESGGARAEDGSDLFMLAYNELQLSAVPPSLPCRETQRLRIHTYLRHAIVSGGRQSTLYVSGLPGTGKTATVFEVVRLLEQEVKSGTLPYFKFVHLNAMQLTHALHAYRDIFFKLTGQIKGVAAAAEALKHYFGREDPSRPITVLLVDEIDFLSTHKQEVLYNLFEWPSMATAKLLVIGIANTMDLPERLLPKISSRASLERVVFPPYTKDQIVTILKSRLGSLQIFEDVALQICAHQVTAVSGDIRRALQLCRRAIELRRRANHDSVPKAPGDRRQLIGTSDIHAANKSIRASHHFQLIAAGTYFERVALVALAQAQQVHGIDTVDFPVAAQIFQTIIRTRAKELPCPRGDEILLLFLRLCDTGLVLESQRSSRSFPLFSLSVPVGDVACALLRDKDKLGEFLKTKYHRY